MVAGSQGPSLAGTSGQAILGTPKSEASRSYVQVQNPCHIWGRLGAGRTCPNSQFLVSLFYDLLEGNCLMATLINQFTWIPIYQELAQVLAGWESRQEELIAFLEELRSEGYVITPLHDRDTDGAR